MQLHFRKNNPLEQVRSSDIFISMLLVIFCIIVLLSIAFISLAKSNTENTKQQYAQSGINEKTNQTNGSSLGYGGIDTGDHSQIGNQNIEEKIRIIKQQSEVQLTVRQNENANPTFAPEQIIPRYFKKFYGDISIMSAKR